MAGPGTGPTGVAAGVANEKARLGAVIVAQVVVAVTVLCNYFILYGLEGNRILLGIVIGVILSIIVGLLYTDLLYDASAYVGSGISKPHWSVDSLIRIFSTTDVIGLFLLVKWSIASDVYFPIFLTLLTIAIILRAPAWWTRGLIVAVGIAYGAALYFPRTPLASRGPANGEGAHALTLLLCLGVIFVEHVIVRRHQEKVTVQAFQTVAGRSARGRRACGRSDGGGNLCRAATAAAVT
ncbi:MAG: hypothetical protein A3A44_03400 [Candidatus Sungbacteria bacterium RIFCSPLOWO2_01_FULL_60_25]|uniref:Uncharacterized protein n=1 Tax=Candidatus Sungbacteria bacterium RIFCSPLOWO2_01_FULL_60_25 TaxID=1802281 RepID=A0A1G2LES1_9BACT|nr:MAG: hypothetical protein A3A44_03400 [Candidatus Sungbacteria bacterium RIFCSPLOWO2_01_FULL_60_25]